MSSSSSPEDEGSHLEAEVDNPADSNAPTGADAAPGPTAADVVDDERGRDTVPPQGDPAVPTADAVEADASGDVASPSGAGTREREDERAAPLPAPDDTAAGGVGAPPGSTSTAVAAGQPAASEGLRRDEARAADAIDPPDPALLTPGGDGAPRGEVSTEGIASLEVEPEPSRTQSPADRGEEAADEPPPAEPVVAPEPEPEPEAHDELRTPLVEALRGALGDAVVRAHVQPGRNVWVRVRPDAWREAGRVAREELGLIYFGFLSAIDWLPSPFGKSEVDGLRRADDIPNATYVPAALDHGVVGGETRFQLLARVNRPGTGVALFLVADVPDDALAVETWTGLYPGANWHERETAEMFGIDFLGHPNLVHLYLPGEFEGYPLRKDFPLLAREVKPWPGLVDVEAMPGEPDDEAAAEEVPA